MGVWSKAFEQFCKPLPKLTGSEWADKYRVVAGGSSPEPGPWRTSRTPYLKEPMDACTDRETEYVVMEFSSQLGKALSLDTPLPTPTGWTTMGELKVGDQLFDDQGKPCTVTMKTGVMTGHRCYCVKFSDGSKIIADGGHRWQVESEIMHLKNGKPTQHQGLRTMVLTTEDLLTVHRECRRRLHRNAFAIPIANPLELEEKSLPIGPYTLGVWLGDGHAYSGQFVGHEDDMAIVENVRSEGYVVEVETRVKQTKNYIARVEPQHHDETRCIRGHLLSEVGLTSQGHCAECARQYTKKYQLKKKGVSFELDPIVNERKSFSTTLREVGLLQNKHIPQEYLRASEPQRWSLLQGIMDTDGCANKNGICEITLKSKRLVDGVYELLASLGLKPTLHEKTACIKERGYSCTVYRLTFVAYQDQRVFRLKRKQERLFTREGRRASETTRRRIVEIEPVDSVPVQCITVDSPSHLFLAGRSMIPTHNSEVLLNTIGYYADQEPSPQLMLQPSLEMAEGFSKERIEPTFQASPGLKGKLEEGKDGRGTAKKSSTTIRMKHYPGGYLALVGANSPAGLASRPIRVLLCDEIDRYGETKEGSPLKLAIQRTQNFENRKIVIVSTPTMDAPERIHDYFLKTDQRHFYVKCPHCGFEHKLEWSDVKWDKDEDGKGIPETAAMFCPSCGAKERGSGKPNPDLLKSGRWIASNPGAKWRGYHCNALYSPWVNLSDLVREFLSCVEKADKHGLKEFVNLKLGEPWSLTGANAGAWKRLWDRREAYPEDKLPDGVLILTAGVDIQRDRVECTVYGWGRDWECWGIRHYIIPGRFEEASTQAQLDAVLSTQWVHSSGLRIMIACACIDSGDGTITGEVYRYTKARERRRIFSIKGRAGMSIPLTSRPTKAGSVGALLFVLGVDTGKQIVMDRLDNETPGPNFVHYDSSPGAGFVEEFFRQVMAETLVPVENKKGAKKLEWKKTRERNEALDCFVYATAAAELCTPNWDWLEQAYEQAAGSAKAQPSAQQAPRRRRGVMSRGVTL